MQTRRDQLQAYRFVTRRVMAALLHGEPDTPESPMRKLAVATFSGVMVAVLAIAGFGVWGLLRPGGAQSVEDPGSLIVEKETGSRYVFNDNDGKLYPVLNYTSARLILDSSDIVLHRVSHASLTKYRRGPTLGIPGAPDSLPDDKALIRKPWTVCSRVEQSPSGNPRPIVTLLAGSDPGGQPFGDNELVVVKVSGQAWVIWHNQRLRASNTAINALPTQQQPLVGAAWLDALPSGPDFKAPRVPDLGATAGYRINGTPPLVGQVFEDRLVGGVSKWYVALKDGLAPILQTEAALLVADPNTRKAYGGRSAEFLPIDTATAGTIAQSSVTISNPDLPHNLPTAAALPDGETTPLCVTYPDPKAEPTAVRVTRGGNVPTAAQQQDGQIPVGAVTNTGAVDQVILPPGGGALVGLVPSPNHAMEIQTYYLIGEQGLKFPIKSADLVAKLGYQTSSAVPLPSNLLRLIPDGPTLDTDAARKPVQIIPQVGSSVPTLPLK